MTGVSGCQRWRGDISPDWVVLEVRQGEQSSLAAEEYPEDSV